jgi:hypothetical protein
MPSEYHTAKPPKCKYCDLPAKRNTVPDKRNRGWYRTCGNKECLTVQWRDAGVNARKAFKGKDGVCDHCKSVFKTQNPACQRWCSVCVPDTKARARIRRYGMSQHEFDIQLLKQKGLCSVCNLRPPTDVDHNHVTGKTREILCGKCNHGLAYMEDLKWKANAEIYLEKHSKENDHSMDRETI